MMVVRLSVIPAKAGTRRLNAQAMGPRLRRNDDQKTAK